MIIAGNATISGVIDADTSTGVIFFPAVNNQGNYVPGVVTVKPGGALDGTGTYGVFDGETLAMETSLTMTNLQVAGGTVVGSGSLTVTMSSSSMAARSRRRWSTFRPGARSTLII